MSSAAQLRKIKKPLIEKRRRERMNDCLNQLKTLVLEGRNTNSNESRYSKMEKVDILEMTVRYLQDLRRSFPVCAGSQPQQSLTAKYIEGYSECASQVGQYLSSTKELSQDIRQRLSQHLVDSLRRTTAPARLTSPSGEHAQAAGILSIGQTIDSRSSFQSAVNTDCASTMLRTSVQSPAVLSTKFAVLETETGSLSPSTRVIIPFYLSSTCSSASPSFIPITHASSAGGQILASATFQPLSASTLFNPTRSTPSTPSPMIFASSASPNLPASSTPSPVVVITGNRDFHGNSVCCSSPRQGDECPSSNNSPSTPPTIATLHIDGWRQQTVPAEKVWRPWNDYPGKMS